MKINKFVLFVSICAISYSVLNMIDLYFTLQYFQWEINPIVLENPSQFYIIKFLSSFMCSTIGLFLFSNELLKRFVTKI